MLMRRHVAAIHGSNEQGKYCSSGFAAFSRLNRNINYLLYFYFTLISTMISMSVDMSLFVRSHDCTRRTADAQGTCNAPQILNIALEKAYNME